MCRSLLKSKQNFRIRAITRNPSSDKARELADLGAEVVQANGFNDKEMLSALAGAWGFWLNTNRFDPVNNLGVAGALNCVHSLTIASNRRFSHRVVRTTRILGGS